jgi:hypothetical protein
MMLDPESSIREPWLMMGKNAVEDCVITDGLVGRTTPERQSKLQPVIENVFKAVEAD